MRGRWVHFLTLILAAMSAVVGSLPQCALCVGPHGHRAIEPVAAGSCGYASGGHSSALESRSAEHCTDIPLGTERALAARNVWLDRVIVAHAIAVTPIFWFAAVPEEDTVWTDGGPPRERLPRTQHTTVILC